MSDSGRANNEEAEIAARLAAIGHPSRPEPMNRPTAGNPPTITASIRSDADIEPRAFLDHDIGEIRIRALGALARLNELTSTDLDNALRDADIRVGLRAARLAARMSPPWRAEVAGLLHATIRRPDVAAELVEASVFALGELLSAESPAPSAAADPAVAEEPQHAPLRDGLEESILQSLIEIARTHQDSLCREAAVAALGSIGDPSARLAVLDALKDRAYVRRRAVVALAAFDGDEVERALSEAIHDRDWQVRDIASALATNESD